jgi:hypothetical protein
MARKPALHLLWALPVAVLLSLPSVAIAGISWCGISGCNSGGWGIDTGYVGLAVGACIGAAVVMAVALAAVPWMKPHGLRIVIALFLGALWGLLIAVITHGPYQWQFG